MREFLYACRHYFGYAFFFSLFVNILQLTFPVFMLQVYDKVLTSFSMATLWVLTTGAVVCLAVKALLEWIRSRLLVRAGIEFDLLLSERVLKRNLLDAVTPAGIQHDKGTLRDVQTLRNFLGGNAIFAFFDIPWMPIYFLLMFVLHPLLGMVGIVGGILVFILGVLTELLTRNRLDLANKMNASSSSMNATAMRNASIVRSMGMVGNISTRWGKMNDQVIRLQTRASHAAGLIRAITQSLRMGLQIAIYAVGAYLALSHQSTAGVMIASSIIMGRALAPIDQAMATYKLSLDARNAYKRLDKLLKDIDRPQTMELPAPVGEVAVENIYFAVGQRQILKGVSFVLPPGQSVAIIGPSAAGKSTLCKVMLGLWTPLAGKIRIDRADLISWDPDRLGPYLGYLPQDVELFSGTVAENIARLGPVDAKKVIRAAQISGTHQMILSLPHGYDTQIGDFGAVLSGGQRQRLGLARAIYGDPKIVVLDEPNSNLDEAGEAGLLQTLLNLKNLHTTVVVVTHRPNILSIVNNILVMQDGQIAMGGPRQEILNKLNTIREEQLRREKEQKEQAERAKLEQQQTTLAAGDSAKDQEASNA